MNHKNEMVRSKISDFEKEISLWETRLSKKEREVSDLSIQIQNIKIALNIFTGEYYLKVGVLYVKIDKLKLSIKEYQHRIDSIQNKKVSVDDLKTIEKEVDEVFSDERSKIDDLEKETSESSEEYEKYLEEEENKQFLDCESQKELKTLFRKLALKFHPDRTRDKNQRKEFCKIFAAINEAYRNGDLETLKKYMKQAERREKIAKETPKEKLARLKEEYKIILGIIKKLSIEVEDLKANETYKLKEKVSQAKKEGKDLLQQLAGDIRKEIAENQVRLDNLVTKYRKIIGGLAD